MYLLHQLCKCIYPRPNSVFLNVTWNILLYTTVISKYFHQTFMIWHNACGSQTLSTIKQVDIAIPDAYIGTDLHIKHFFIIITIMQRNCHTLHRYSICVHYMPCTSIGSYIWLFCKLEIQKGQRFLAWIFFFLLCVKTSCSLACEANTIGPITNTFSSPSQIKLVTITHSVDLSVAFASGYCSSNSCFKMI